MPQPQNPTLFHFTAISNLDNIFACRRLKSKNILAAKGLIPTNIAYTHIQDRRHIIKIPNTNNSLHDYVPFMFAPRSPMMFAIIRGNVSEAEETNQENLIYFVTSFNIINNLEFIFTDYQATCAYASFYQNPAELNKINWDLFFETPLVGGYCKYFHKKEGEKYLKRPETRGAEFLFKDEISLEKIEQIAVKSEYIKKIVENKLNLFKLNISVVVKPEWYF